MRSCSLAGAVTALLLGLASARARAGDPTFRVAPAPSWVNAVDAEIDAAAPEGATHDGVQDLLSDLAVRISGSGVERYLHVARKVRVSKSSAEQRVNRGGAAGHDGMRSPRSR